MVSKPDQADTYRCCHCLVEMSEELVRAKYTAIEALFEMADQMVNLIGSDEDMLTPFEKKLEKLSKLVHHDSCRQLCDLYKRASEKLKQINPIKSVLYFERCVPILEHLWGEESDAIYLHLKQLSMMYDSFSPSNFGAELSRRDLDRRVRTINLRVSKLARKFLGQ